MSTNERHAVAPVPKRTLSELKQQRVVSLGYPFQTRPRGPGMLERLPIAVATDTLSAALRLP